MRWVSFVRGADATWGITDGARVLDLPEWAAQNGTVLPDSLVGALAAGVDCRSLADAAAGTLSGSSGSSGSSGLGNRSAPAVPITDVELLSPIPLPPRNVFCLGANYRDHVDESRNSNTLPDQPIYFTKASTSVAPPRHTLAVDQDLVGRLDWEIELAVVLARGGRNISAGTALDHVLGYTVGIDLSARDVQFGRPEGQWFLGKSSDGFCPLGPWIVGTDEIPDPQAVDLSLSVNGVVKQQANTAGMVFGIREVIADLSRYVTLLPGDIIMTGTPAGVGDAMDPPEYLRPGDRVVGGSQQIGEITVDISDINPAARAETRGTGRG